jgi:hypothetical protein
MNFLNEFVLLCEFLEKLFLKHAFLLLDVFSQQTFPTIRKPKSWKERKKNQHCFKGLLCCYAYHFIISMQFVFTCVFDLMLRNTKLYV